MKNAKKIIKVILIALVWLLIWEAISLLVGKEVLFPSPIVVFLKLIQMAGTASFWASIGTSILRILIGFLCGVLLGSVIGILTALSKILDDFLSPISRIIRATPVASFIILLFVFLAKNNIPAVTAFLMVFPITWANIYEGIKATDKELLEMAQVFKLGRGSVLKNIYLPQIMPFFIASIKSGMGLAWKAGIAAEVLTNPTYGIGTGLYNSKIYLETTELFAWTAVIIIISVILEKIAIKLIDKLNND